jgi:hypothetical protein
MDTDTALKTLEAVCSMNGTVAQGVYPKQHMNPPLKARSNHPAPRQTLLAKPHPQIHRKRAQCWSV